MPIDSSIYSQQQAPDFGSAIQKGLTLRQMANDMGRKKDIEDAYKAGTVTAPDGSTTFDNQRTMSALAKVDPREAMAFQQHSQELDAEKQKILQAKQSHTIDMVARVAPNIKDQASYEDGLKTLGAAGVDVSKMPMGYDPNVVSRYSAMAVDAIKQREMANKDKQTATEQQNADAKTLEARASAANAGLPFDQTAGMGRRNQPPQMPPLATNKNAPGSLVANNGPGGAMGKPSLLEDDPADMLKNVPAKDREKVAAEIDAAKNAVQNGPKIMKAFDNAYGQHAIDYVPWGQNVDQKSFHALLGPTFKDVEGTVRQAAMDNMFANTTPQFGDNDHSKKTKRDTTKDYLSYKSSGALSKAYGIDLSRYKSTNVGSALDAQEPPSGDAATTPADKKVLKTHEIEWKN